MTIHRPCQSMTNKIMQPLQGLVTEGDTHPANLRISNLDNSNLDDSNLSISNLDISISNMNIFAHAQCRLSAGAQLRFYHAGYVHSIQCFV